MNSRMRIYHDWCIVMLLGLACIALSGDRKQNRLQYATEPVVIDAPWRVERQTDRTLIPFVVGIWAKEDQSDAVFYFRSFTISNVTNGNIIYTGSDIIDQVIPRRYNIPFYRSQIKLIDVTGLPDGIYFFDVSIEYYLIESDGSHKDSGVYTKRLRVNLTDQKLPAIDGWKYGDTHFHTVFTNQRDDTYELETGGDAEMIKYAGKSMGLNWVTTTDHSRDASHNYLDSSTWHDLEIACQNYNDSQFSIIPGEELYLDEIGFNSAHMIVLGNDKFIESNPLNTELSDVFSKNGIAFAAHPQDGNYSWNDTEIATALANSSFIGLELWNTFQTRKTDTWNDTNEMVNPFEWETTSTNFNDLNEGIQRWHTLLTAENNRANSRKIFIAGGSDAHGDFNYVSTQNWLKDNSMNNNAFAKVRTAVYLPYGLGTGGQNVLTALRNGTAIITNGPFATINLDLNGDGLVPDQTDNVKIGEECYCEISNLTNNLSQIVVNYKNTSEFGGPIDTLRLINNNRSYMWNRSDLDKGSNSEWDERFPLLSKLYEKNTTPVVGDRFFLRLQAFSKLDTFRCYTNPIWIKVVPDLEITSPLAGQCITGTQQVIEVNTGSSDMTYYKKVEFYANDELIYTDTQAPFKTTWDLGNLKTGENVLRIKGFDAIDGIHEKSITVNAPNNALTNGQVIPPTGDVNQSFIFSVIYSSTCNLPPDGNVVQLYVDGTSYPMSSSTINWQSGATFSYSKSQLSAGTHTYYFTAAQNGRTLRFPDSGSRDLIVSQSTAGWDIAIVPSGTSYSPQTITSNTNITVYATIKNEGAAGNIYSSVTIKAKLISPSGSLLAEDSEIVSSVAPNISYQRSLTLQMPSQVSSGNHQILISLTYTPDLESDFSDNTYSLYFYVGAAVTSEQYAVDICGTTHAKNNVFQINSQSFTLLGVSSDGLVATFRLPNGGTSEINKYSLRTFSAYDAAIAVQSIITGSSSKAILQYGPEVTNGPSFVSKEIALLPGNTAYFEVSAPSGKQFVTSKDEYEIFRQGSNPALIEQWFIDVVTSENDRKAKFYFTVPSGTTPANYVCYLSSKYTTDYPQAHLTRLQINVLAPAPIVERISSTLISADDDLTIAGSNFLSSGSVKFNELTGTVKTWSATSIVVTVPQGVQSGSLMVVTSAGASNSAAYSVKSSTGAPEVLTNIPNQILKSGEQKFVIDLKQVFSDPNSDPLTFNFSSTQPTLTANTDSLAQGRLLLIAAADANGTAQVTIVAKDPRNRSASTSFDVTLNAIPPAPILILPENQVEQVALSPQLIWHKALSASSYICQLSKASDFGTVSLNLTNLTDTLTTAGSLSPLTTYYWRVAGKNANGTGAFSLVRSFKTKSNLPNQAPLLSWTSETGYIADGLNPDSPDIITPVVLRVKYLDTDNDAPMVGYPKVHVKKGGVEISGSPFVMEAVNSDAYSTGRIFQKSLNIATAGTDYSYVFEAQDAEGNTATGEPVTARSFTVNNPVPVVSTIGPTQKTINSAEFTLTVNGSNFVSTSVVRFGGQDRATQFISSTQLTATILAADLATLGDYPITVINPTPGGGTSVENVVLQVIEVPDNGPLAYYPFNNSPNDESGNGNHGTNTGSPTPCADRFGRANKAYFFDGIDDAVVINMSAAMASYSVGPHSYSVWVNRPAGSGDVEFIVDAGGASQDQRGVRYSSEGYPSVKWVISSSSVNTTATTVPSYNVWHHLAGVYTGTEVLLYVDGQLASSIPKSGTGNVLSIMKIGNISESANPNQNFTGKIDDVRIYNRALSFQEVLDLFSEPAESENHLPELLWTAETGYTADGLNPDTPDIVSPAVLRVKYRDADNNAPKDGYPKVHIKKGGVEISGSPFVMEAVNSDAYSTGRIFQKSLTIATAGTDYSYVFEAQDAEGNTATGEPVTARSFTVNNPVPVVSTIGPTQKTINSAEFTLTVNGSNFVSTSVVRFGGQDRATQFISSTQLTATILAADLVTLGDYPITVINPAPGGGVSTASVIFTVTLSPAGTMFAHYTLAGIGTDVSGNERHGTLFGPTPTADKSGVEGQALYFDGSDDYVDLPFSSQALGSAVTISAWVYRTGSSTGTYVQGIVSNDSKSDRGISIGAYPENGPTPASANKLQVSVYNDMNTSADLLGVVIPLSQWQFVGMVADGTYLKIYQDGQLQGSKPFSGNLRGSTNFHIGHDQYDEFSERYWHGTIDNVRFYDRALSATEIAEIYALEGGTAVNHPPVVTALLPNSGSFKDPVFISATATDPDASDQVVAIKYEYNLGGTDWVAVGEDATPGDPLAWTSGLNWNLVNLRAKAFDGELWSTDWFVTMGSFTVDNTPPQFSGWITSPADLTTLVTGPLHVSVKVGDDFSGFGANVPQLDYYLTGASYDGYEAMTQLDAATWTYIIPEPAGGWSAQGGKTLYFKARAADELGNIAESTEQTRPVYSGPVPPLVHYDFDQNCLNKGTGGSGWDLDNDGAAYDASVVRLGTAAARLTQSAASQQNFKSGSVTTELGEPFTISGWFKWDGSPFLMTSGHPVLASQQCVGAIMGQGDYPGDIPCEGNGSRHWALSLDTQNRQLGFVINSAGCGGERQQNWSESQTVNANQWNWFCLCHDGTGVLSLYLNDVLAASRTDHVTGGSGEFNTGLYVGSGYYYYYSTTYPDYEVTTYFPGHLDDIRIYRHELSAAERSSLYHEGGWPINSPPVVTALTPASGNHSDPVQLSALYADADASDIVSALQYQYSLDGSSGWTEIVEDVTPADGYAWNSGMAGTALYLRARAFDGKEWGNWYTNTTPICIVIAATTHTLNLPAGWSMISSYVIPAENSLPVLFSDILADMTILKNGTGSVYWPQFTINTIGAWNHLAGYQIFMKNTATLEITGQAVLPESTPIPLNQGWNTISYLRNSSQNVTAALSNIVSSMVIAKNGAGRVYWPAFTINTIGNMVPGEGYQLYMNQAATLTYAANSLPKNEGVFSSLSFSSRHYQPFLVNSVRNWIIGIDGGALEEGDEVSAWTRSSKLLAAGAIAQGKTVLVIPGDDPMTEDAVEGCAEDEKVVLRIWRRSDGLELPLDCWSAEDALTGVPLGDHLTYRTDAVTIVRTSASKLLTVSGYRLEQNFPNPFNPETSIRFALPKAEAVRLVVMNLQGQQIRVLVDEQCASGSHRVVWDGRDDYGHSVASGLYIVRMVSGGFTANLKISFVQ